jgi:branched-subunit amino acid transport protein
VSWPAIAALALGTYLLRAIGPVLVGGRRLPPRLAEVFALLPAALLAALVVVQALGGNGGLALDARLVGVAAAGLAVWLRAPFLAVIVVGAATAALLRAAGLG